MESQETIQVALIQSPLVWENPSANRISFEEKIRAIKGKADLVILPEMFTTGFTMSPEHVNRSEGTKTLEWMQFLAQDTHIALTGSLVFPENDAYFNRLFFVKPDGSFQYYNKRHTFTLAGEHKKYVAGTKRTIVDYKGFRFFPLICYDLRFPVWSRNTMDFDVLIYVANWPKPRIAAWDALLKARAIENMAYSIGVNRVGLDGLGYEYVGHSAAYDVLGNQLTFAGKEEIVFVTLDKQHIQKNREKLQFLEDRDNFTLL